MHHSAAVEGSEKTIFPAAKAHDKSEYAIAESWPLWAFSFCIVALSFKQLRAYNLAGPAEYLTAVAALVVIINGVRRRAWLHHGYILGGIAVFAILSLGGIWALVVEPGRLSLRETMAYLFNFLVLIAFLTLARRRETTALAILAVVIALYLGLISALALLPNPLQPMMWFHKVRLQGFSDNPNQIAMLAIIGLGLLAYAEYAKALRRTITIPLALACALAGMSSESSAFVTAQALSMGVLVAWSVANRLWRKDESSAGPVGRPPLSLVIAATLVLVVSFVQQQVRSAALNELTKHWTWSGITQLGGDASLDGVIKQQVTRMMDSDEQQGTVRINLWKQALSVGLQSPLVGFGPGYHLHPQAPTLPQEAHNTVLDLFLVSGLAGVLSLGAIAAIALWGGYRNERLWIVLAMAIAITAFSMFHFVGRQPLFWIMIVAIIHCAGPYGFLSRVLHAFKLSPLAQRITARPRSESLLNPSSSSPSMDGRAEAS